MPCSQESWNPYTVSAGDCYGDTEYQGAYDYPGTCGAWSTASTSGSCGDFQVYALVKGSCHSCIGEACCSQTLACAAATDCGALYGCYEGCMGDPTCAPGAGAGECACRSVCDGKHPEGLNALQAWEQCVASGCEAPCSSGG
jgi:hypothetical protein